MEAVLKSLESTVQLLAVSHTDYVKEWNMATVDRAFQWAQYCENLHSRFHANPPLRAAFEKRLCETNELLELTLSGYNRVTVRDLAQCRHRLLLGLLKNPATPHSLIRSLLNKFEAPDNGERIVPNTSELIAYRSACKLFSDLPLNRSGFGFSLVTQVHGMMLLQRLNAIQSRPGGEASAKTLLDSVFQDTIRKNSFSDLLASALLSEECLMEDNRAPDFLLDWLQMHQDLLNSMCQTLPPDICTRLSKQYPKFRLAYWDALKKWASLLDYDVSSGLWVQQCDSAVSFQILMERIQSLWSSGPPLKEDTMKELTLLKQSDGDFEVRGLSVWTDIHMHLKGMVFVQRLVATAENDGKPAVEKPLSQQIVYY